MDTSSVADGIGLMLPVIAVSGTDDNNNYKDKNTAVKVRRHE